MSGLKTIQPGAKQTGGTDATNPARDDYDSVFVSGQYTEAGKATALQITQFADQAARDAYVPETGFCLAGIRAPANQQQALTIYYGGNWYWIDTT